MSDARIKVTVPTVESMMKIEGDPSSLTFEQRRDVARSAVVQLAATQPELADAWLKVAERIQELHDEEEMVLFVQHMTQSLRKGIESAAYFNRVAPQSTLS